MAAIIARYAVGAVKQTVALYFSIAGRSSSGGAFSSWIVAAPMRNGKSAQENSRIAVSDETNPASMMPRSSPRASAGRAATTSSAITGKTRKNAIGPHSTKISSGSVCACMAFV